MGLMLVAWPCLMQLQNTQATSSVWRPGTWEPCSKCHTGGITATKSVNAPDTVTSKACLSCHSPSYNPYGASATAAHPPHAGLTSDGKTPGLGSMAKHPSVGSKSCSDCHATVSCTACHKTGAHVTSGSNCSQCHSTLSNYQQIPAHKYNVTLSDGSHKVFGSDRSACFACHDNYDVDKYQLANGTSISSSPDLCRQCHYNYYDAWNNGTHHDSYYQTNFASSQGSCAGSECHDPHKPYLSKTGISPTYPSVFKVPIFGMVPPLFIGTIAIFLAIIALAVLLVIRSKRK